jgi:hypothetical protein
LIRHASILLECTYLLISNGEFALRLLVRLRVLVQSLDRIVIEHSLSEFDVSLGVFMARIDFSVIWESCEGLVQGFVHFLGGALEKAAAAADEHCVSGKHGAIVAVFEEKAYTVLCMTWGVQSGHIYGSDVELGLVAGCLGYELAVTTTDYRDVESFGLSYKLIEFIMSKL